MGVVVVVGVGAVACTTESTTTTTGGTGSGNLEPVAVAAATPTSGNVPLDVQFDASGSYDSDGVIVSFEWNFGDSTPVVTEKNPAHTYTSAGTYLASLVVTDSLGATALDTISIDVAP